MTNDNYRKFKQNKLRFCIPSWVIQNSSEHIQAITVDFLADAWTTQDFRQEQMTDEDIGPVSYTHLDVYKRQVTILCKLLHDN